MSKITRRALLGAALALLFTWVSADAFRSPGMHGSGGGGSYVGPCDLITGGCAEAYSMTRAMTFNYSGPLFQIGLYSSPHMTMDVPQTSRHTIDMTRVLSFCGGAYSRCAISKMYAQIHGSANDAVPNFLTGGPGNEPANCGDRDRNTALSCACPLKIDVRSGVPINPLGTAGVSCQYTLVNDQSAVGIIGGSSSDISNILIGQAPGQYPQSCGAFGISHFGHGGDVSGEMFEQDITYGTTSTYINCTALDQYCLSTDFEGNGQPSPSNGLGTSQLYVVSMISWDHSSNILNGVANGHREWTPQAPQHRLAPPTSIHFGAGGDLCQPVPSFNFYESLLTNTVISPTAYAGVLANVRAAYPTLTFP